jgi:quercetin dioxygenase-like cupin family protein
MRAMVIQDVPFCVADWNSISPEVHPGLRGEARWRTFEMGNIRVRMVEYTPGYQADHWCSRGHVLLVLDGELNTELDDGRVFKMIPGKSYQVAEGMNPHRSFTETGAKLFIVD